MSEEAKSLHTIPYEFFVGIKLHGSNKAYYFGTNDDSFHIGDKVVVDTAAGLELGEIATECKSTSIYKSNLELKPILRRPTLADVEDYNLGLSDAKIALKIAEREIANLGLPMRLLDAHYTLDGSKCTITYSADNRVDFRELLKILAPQLHCRIELYQLAPRDRAKSVGGIGACGLPLCCSTFLNRFDGISLNRAKNQMLSLNTPKLSGACGKLVCCLLYEDDLYTEAKKDFPRIGTIVHDGANDYSVDGYNILARTVKLVSPIDVKFVTLEEFEDLVHPRPKKPLEPVKEPVLSENDGTKPNRTEGGRNNNNKHRRHFNNKHNNRGPRNA